MGGVDAIVDILNTVDRGTEKHIMESLEIEEPELADEIRKKMFVFEDILLLDDRAIQRVLRDVDNNDLAVALKGANEEVQNVIFKNLSKRLAAMIREDMEFMGPVRMKDVEEAQQKIVGIIRKLEDSAEIVISVAEVMRLLSNLYKQRFITNESESRVINSNTLAYRILEEQSRALAKTREPEQPQAESGGFVEGIAAPTGGNN